MQRVCKILQVFMGCFLSIESYGSFCLKCKDDCVVSTFKEHRPVREIRQMLRCKVICDKSHKKTINSFSWEFRDRKDYIWMRIER